eukprot:Clim_evm34s77 gene=Clim_evmTU34s77
MKVSWDAKAYEAVCSHVMKYPAQLVTGLLLGKVTGEEMNITACAPAFHNLSSSVVQLEVLIGLVDSYCKSNGLTIVGAYVANTDPKSYAIPPALRKFAEQNVDNNGGALLAAFNVGAYEGKQCGFKMQTRTKTTDWAEVAQESVQLKGGSFAPLNITNSDLSFLAVGDFEDHLNNPGVKFIHSY